MELTDLERLGQMEDESVGAGGGGLNMQRLRELERSLDETSIAIMELERDSRQFGTVHRRSTVAKRSEAKRSYPCAVLFSRDRKEMPPCARSISSAPFPLLLVFSPVLNSDRASATTSKRGRWRFMTRSRSRTRRRWANDHLLENRGEGGPTLGRP
jgi:hypothetical protein